MNKQSARNVREFVAVVGRDDEDRPSVLRTPGHNGKVYEVTLTRSRCVSATCVRIDGTACKGSSHAVCYHVQAACEVAAEDAGLKLSWCDSQADAERLARIEGKTFCVESAQSGKRAWGVVKGHNHKPFDLLAWAEWLDKKVSWYDACLARALAKHGADKPQQVDALRQLLVKHPEQHDNLAKLFPQAVLEIGRNLLRGEEAEL